MISFPAAYHHQDRVAIPRRRQERGFGLIVVVGAGEACALVSLELCELVQNSSNWRDTEVTLADILAFFLVLQDILSDLRLHRESNTVLNNLVRLFYMVSNTQILHFENLSPRWSCRSGLYDLLAGCDQDVYSSGRTISHAFSIFTLSHINANVRQFVFSK